MKFKQGYLVEVLRREDEPCGSWFPGNIISADGNYYLVRYGSVMDQEGEVVLERVHRKDVRPRPPLRKVKKWVVGDVAEMFDTQCWRVGKIAKELKNNIFVVKLFGSIQLKEFHGSNIRIRQAWHEDKWSITGKVARNEESTNKYHQIMSKHPGSLDCRAPSQLRNKDSCLREKHGPIHLEDGSSNVKGDLTFNKKPYKMDSDLVKGSAWWLYASSRPLRSEDSRQGSVSSCSSNNVDNFPIYNYGKSLNNTADNLDAESSIPSCSVVKHCSPDSGQDLEANIHELEFHAYRSTVQALYALGPLSWEQESLLTNLRLCLNISDEEHLQQLRYLLST